MRVPPPPYFVLYREDAFVAFVCVCNTSGVFSEGSVASPRQREAAHEWVEC